MSAFVSRPYRRSDLPALIRFAQDHVRASMPAPSYYHPGDIAWQLYPFDASDDVRIWSTAGDDARIVAVAIFEPPLDFQFALHPDVDDPDALTSELLRWIDQGAPETPDPATVPLAYLHLGAVRLSTWVIENNDARIGPLTRHGFVRGERSGVRFELDLTHQLPEIELPEGARFRRIGDSDEDIAARAELHRDAWSVWGRSRFSDDRYRQLRGSPLYDPDLDIVLEHEGRLVSYCICWIDTANGVGMFEPVGTRPSAAQRGYGRAVIREGFRRLRDRGMTIARVATGTINPPAVALYQSAGFTPTTHDRHFCLPAAKIGTE